MKMTETDYKRESLISSGFRREFIYGLSVGLVNGLFEVWDKEDPDAQWDVVDSFLMNNKIDTDVNKIFW